MKALNTRDAAARWARTWTQAWEALDVEAIVALYAPDALHSTEPYRGREAVRDYVVRVFGEEEDPRYGPRNRSSTATAHRSPGGPASARREATSPLAGTSVLRFDDAGLVVEQWDAWNATTERRDPPTVWGPFR